jgi:AcrR family transcriptional regulator
MGKAFSATEAEIIRKKLIESCKLCWERYGYKKTSIVELASMVGISAGAFYAFYSSKELLFMETADYYGNQITKAIVQNMPNNPTKYDLADAVKMLMEELSRNRWILSMQQDSELFMRRLPRGFLEKNQRKDLIDITEIIRQFGLEPKVSMEELTAVIHTLSVSAYFTDMIGEYHKQAMGLLIDGVIEKLFE